MRKTYIAPIAAGVLLALAGTAQAVTRSATFPVSATVTEICTINAAPLFLGDFNGADDLETATSTITIRCTANTDFDVGLNAGLTGTFANRVLVGPNGNTLRYNLYTTAARDVIWNDTTNRVSDDGEGMGSPVLVPVFGKVLAADNTGELEPGTYNDTITATVEY